MRRHSTTSSGTARNPPLWFAGRFWPRRIAERKFLFAGMSGSGKTLGIRLLNQTALYGFGQGIPRRALYYDAKGDWPAIIHGVFEHWGHPNPPRVKKLAPFDANGYGYDFQADFDRSYNPFGTAANLAKTLIPVTGLGGDKNSQFFTSAAQLVLAWVTLLVHERAKRWTLRDIIVAATDGRIIRVLFEQDDRARAILRKFEETPQTYSNVLQTVESFLWELEPAALAWEHHLAKGRRLTFRDWLRGDDILILSGTDPNPHAVEPINALLLEFLRQELRNQPECPWYEPDSPETWLFLDEFQNVAPLPHLVDFFTLSRSKGATQVIGVQEVDQLVHNYGEEIANTILGQCGYVAVTKLASPASAGYFEKRVGSFEEMKKFEQTGQSYTSSSGPGGSSSSHTTNTGTTQQLLTRPGVLAQQFTQLEEVRAGLTIDAYYIANGPYERREFSARFGECPLAPIPAGFTSYRPLKPASLTRPRAYSLDDFDRLGFARADVPSDYHRKLGPEPTHLETLLKMVRGWKAPRDTTTLETDVA
ncbi:type IV secretion system DNA-binding domain-containing protein [bacterium]|nr:type IV secretion system DNA-binding domain-containing protein [bacterium]